MHSEKVPYYILDLLQQVPSVYVQGLGRFDAIFHPAVIDLQHSQIKPPHVQPGFIPQTGSESDLLPAYMHYVSGIEFSEAIDIVSLFVSEVTRRIDAGEIYNIEKFGTFSKSASGIIHFTPDWDAFNLSFSGLEVIDLHPLQEAAPSERLIKPHLIVPEVIQPSVEMAIESPAEISQATIPEEGETEPSLEIKPASRPELAESTSRLAWVVLTSALLLITVLCAFLAWDIISDRKEINQLARLYSDTLVITNEFDIPVTMDTLSTREDSIAVAEPAEIQDTIQKPEVTKATEPPCYVVVGAFTDPGNVDRMVRRLEGLGYEPARLKGGNFTRVAISTSCDKENLQKILIEARSGINPEAWIY